MPRTKLSWRTHLQWDRALDDRVQGPARGYHRGLQAGQTAAGEGPAAYLQTGLALTLRHSISATQRIGMVKGGDWRRAVINWAS